MEVRYPLSLLVLLKGGKKLLPVELLVALEVRKPVEKVDSVLNSSLRRYS